MNTLMSLVLRADIAEHVSDLAFRLLGEYDAFQDNPWPLLYEEVDRRCPNSKFVLTIRDDEEWICSICAAFGSFSTPMRELVYGKRRGAPRGNESVYLEAFRQHNEKVRKYFRQRDRDLLVLNIVEGEGWEELCPFLSKEIPPVDFPHIRPGKAADWGL